MASTSACLAEIYSSSSLTTALSSLDPWGNQIPVSTSPSPALTVRMLQALDIRDGYRVLEIGTGTGHTAGLLCHRLDASRVTSIEIDPELHTQAADRLAELGHRPDLVLTDGVDGAPGRGQLMELLGALAEWHQGNHEPETEYLIGLGLVGLRDYAALS